MLTYDESAAFILITELLIAKEVIEHSKNTDYDALYVKVLIIFKNFARFAGYYLAFCFKTLSIANCKISPMSSRA